MGVSISIANMCFIIVMTLFLSCYHVSLQFFVPSFLVSTF